MRAAEVDGEENAPFGSIGNFSDKRRNLRRSMVLEAVSYSCVRQSPNRICKRRFRCRWMDDTYVLARGSNLLLWRCRRGSGRIVGQFS